MNDRNRLPLDWSRLLGFDQAEISPEELRRRPDAAALVAKLSNKPGGRAKGKS